MGENLCKQGDLQGINFQNIQTSHGAFYQTTTTTTTTKWAEMLFRTSTFILLARLEPSPHIGWKEVSEIEYLKYSAL